MDMGTFIISLFAGGIKLGMPLTAAALGETYSQRSGVLSIGLEGYMTLGAAFSFVGAYFSGNPWLGVLLGMAVGGLLGLLHAYLTVSRKLNQIVSGLGIYFLAVGIAAFLIFGIFHEFTGMPKILAFNPINIPVLGNIPAIGTIFFRHGALTYLTFALVPGLWYVLYKTKLGLKIRAVGEYASGSDAAGVNVTNTRYICATLSGIMGGLGGSALALEINRTFVQGMVAGRGFIVMAAVVLGGWNPARALGACVLFGLVDAFQFRMQALAWWGIPWEIWAMTPYIVTIVALLAVRQVRVPKELCVPYSRE